MQAFNSTGIIISSYRGTRKHILVVNEKFYSRLINSWCHCLVMNLQVICAFGRLGTMFACEKYNIKPDLLTIAKVNTPLTLKNF